MWYSSAQPYISCFLLQQIFCLCRAHPHQWPPWRCNNVTLIFLTNQMPRNWLKRQTYDRHRINSLTGPALWAGACKNEINSRIIGVYRKFQGGFKIVSKVVQGTFKGLSCKFQGGLKRVSKMFQGYFLEVSRVSPECFKGVFKKMLNVFQKSFILHITHRSFPSRGRIV